ncbi:methionine biosynthesis protein MetW [Dehalococcoidales bacterium]|nr:methionine biosynthesis protein MetW [Dehalococcoidales bacterium]
MLDIGCGDGTLLEYLGKEKGIKGLGVEISQKAIELAKAKGVKVIKADITKDDFQLNETFNYIILADVLEHMPNAEEIILKLKGHFTKYVIVNLPNSGFIIDRLRLLFGRFPKQWLLHPSEHLRFWTVNDFIFWCSQLGFQVEKYFGMQIQFYEFFPQVFCKYYPKLFSRDVLYLLKEQK